VCSLYYAHWPRAFSLHSLYFTRSHFAPFTPFYAGKTTAVTRTILKKQQEGGVNGAVYFEVPAKPEAFALSLAKCLGESATPLDPKGGLKRRINNATMEEPAWNLANEPGHTWAWLSERLTAAGVAFKTKHDRPMTLVLDGVERLAQPETLKFLEELQVYAKQRACAGDINIVFMFR
jgi:hypothetical protein